MNYREIAAIQNSFWSLLEGLEREYHCLHHNDFAKEFHQHLNDGENLKASHSYCNNTYDVMKRRMASRLGGRL